MTNPTPTPQPADSVVLLLYRIAEEVAINCQYGTAAQIRAAADSIAQRDASHPVAADQVERPSLADVDELCAEFGFHCDDDDYSLLILRDMITAAITRWPLPALQPAAQPVNLAKLRDPDFSGGLTPSQHLDVVHGGADPTWQSIKTAPKDGTLVLTISESGYLEEVISDNYKLCNFSFLQYNRTMDTWVDRLGSSGYFPTHWQPLPVPPNTINQPS